VKVYVVPLVSPVTVALVTGAATVTTIPPGAEVTVKVVIGLPPSERGTNQLTVAEASLATVVTLLGTVGGLAAQAWDWWRTGVVVTRSSAPSRIATRRVGSRTAKPPMVPSPTVFRQATAAEYAYLSD
jgi:hypothetical protein